MKSDPKILYMRVDYVEPVLTRRTANVIAGECNPNLVDPPGLWVIISFRFGTPYWTAIGQSTCESVFGATCPTNETPVGNDDPNQPYTSLAVCAKWSVIDRHGRYMRCLRESAREQ